MMKKKAAIEVQFNWIFVMIAGALILVFFFGIVQKQRELSQAKISNSLLTNIESIATGAGVSRGTVQKVALPNIGITFSCTEECLCAYSIDDIRKEYRDKIIFSPSLVQGAEVVLWTLDWNAPFRITNIIYATTANDKYFFVYNNPNSALMNLFNKSLPAEINAEFVPSTQYTKIKYENYNSAKFIFADYMPPDNLGLDNSFRRAKVSAVYLSSGGDAVFYDKTSRTSLEFKKKISSYFGEPFVYGAVFAPDSNSYECSVLSALKRMRSVLNLYGSRTEDLDEQNNQQGFCTKGYSTLNIEDLRNMINTASKNPATFKSMASPVSSITTQNEELLRGSCPLIY